MMSEVNKVLHQIDVDGSGTINYTEFIASCM
jgi:Ca2+-binding EF-hand superfamily protein